MRRGWPEELIFSEKGEGSKTGCEGRRWKNGEAGAENKGKTGPVAVAGGAVDFFK